MFIYNYYKYILFYYFLLIVNLNKYKNKYIFKMLNI